MTTNMKPADELLMLRKKIKELQAHEKELSAKIKNGDASMNGDFAIARTVKRKSTRFDKKAAEDELGDLSRFNVQSETIALMVEELVQELVE